MTIPVKEVVLGVLFIGIWHLGHSMTAPWPTESKTRYTTSRAAATKHRTPVIKNVIEGSAMPTARYGRAT
jgi:hypothetical protein